MCDEHNASDAEHQEGMKRGEERERREHEEIIRRVGHSMCRHVARQASIGALYSDRERAHIARESARIGAFSPPYHSLQPCMPS